MNKYKRYVIPEERSFRVAEEEVLGLARQSGVLRSRELTAHRLPRVTLTRLQQQKRLKRVGRGLYVLPQADLSEHHSLAQAMKRVPHGVVCLLSALKFHGLTTQNPSEIWLAINVSARKPRVSAPPLHIVRFSGRALTYGIETHRVEGIPVRVTSTAKTVADGFKYRHKIGLDVALEALRDYRRTKKSLDELWKAAEVCRVATVMRPYLALLT